jgi:hypothetical protein
MFVVNVTYQNYKKIVYYIFILNVDIETKYHNWYEDE